MLLSTLDLMPVNLIQLLTLFISVFGIFLLYGEPRYKGAILALSIQSLSMFFNFLEETELVHTSIFVTPSFSLAVGPSLYLLIRVLLEPENPLFKSDLWHYLPAILSIPFAQYVEWIHAMGALSQVIYLKFALVLLKRYHRAIRERRSDIERLKLNWLFGLFFTLMLLVIVEVIRVNLQPFLPYDFRNLWYLLDQVIILVVICWLLIGLIRQPEVFSGLSEYVETESQTKDVASNDEARTIFGQLDSLVQQELLFQQPRLALQDLANLSGLSTKDVSWAINQGGKQSFADYINQLRVKHAIERALESPDRTLLEIALDSGFSSKSSFNAVFKKHTGKSPTQYLKSLES